MINEIQKSVQKRWKTQTQRLL